MKYFFRIFVVFLPWFIRRKILIKCWKYEIHPSARIGLSYIYPKYLKMEKGSRIDHFSIGIHLDSISLGENSSIGRSNWITGFPTNTKSNHFFHQKGRKSKLIIGSESAITKKHHIDCTSSITIGNFCTVAGYDSQLLTHSINVYENRQDSRPIKIGDYTFLGTNVTLLGGAELPSHSVLAAKSLLTKSFKEEWMIYGGVPAIPLKEISKEAKYFQRETGFVY